MRENTTSFFHSIVTRICTYKNAVILGVRAVILRSLSDITKSVFMWCAESAAYAYCAFVDPMSIVYMPAPPDVTSSHGL